MSPIITWKFFRNRKRKTVILTAFFWLFWYGLFKLLHIMKQSWPLNSSIPPFSFAYLQSIIFILPLGQQKVFFFSFSWSCKPRAELVLHNLFKLLWKNQFCYIENDAIPIISSVLKGSAVSGFMGQYLGDVVARNTHLSQREYSSSERNQHFLFLGSQEARR